MDFAPTAAVCPSLRHSPRCCSGLPVRLMRISATAVLVGGLSAAVMPGAALAAPTTWRQLDPGHAVNGHPAEITAPGYAVSGILARGESPLGRYKNFQDSSTGAYCIIAGLPYSEAADIAETLDDEADPIVAYALSKYGDAKDRATTTAVSWIAHAQMEKGTTAVSAAARRAAFEAALEDAPSTIQDRVNQIVQEAKDYRAPTMDERSLATGVKITGSAEKGDLGAVVDVPDGHESVVTISGDATFDDGTKSATIDKDSTLRLSPAEPLQGNEAAVKISVDPVDERVVSQATTISTYRQAGTDSRGRAYQVMAWAVPTVKKLTTATASVRWKAPYTPPEDVATHAVDQADGDGIINPGGTVQDTYSARGLAPSRSYRLKTTIISLDEGEPTDISTTTRFTAEKETVSVVTAVDLPADLPVGTYAVSQVLHGPDGAVLDRHDGTQHQSQQFRLAAPRIGTTATDRADGDKSIAHTGGTLTDVVAYENLRLGVPYEVRGTVMDKATGEPLRNREGKKVTATARFTPTTASGTVHVDFTLDSAVAGRTLVVFEDLHDAEGVVIAHHRDLDDEGQTVRGEKTPPTSKTTSPPPAAPSQKPSRGPAAHGAHVRTGGTAQQAGIAPLAGILLTLGAAGMGTGGLIWRRARRHDRR